MTLSRRNLLAVAAGGAAALAAGCGDTEGEARDDPASGDIEVVNYALMLEQLETAFYDQVVASGVLGGREAALMETIAQNERQHMVALEGVSRRLGRRPPDPPGFDFDEVLAGGRDRIIQVSADFENTGAGAYLEEASRITDPDLLGSALAIHAVEGRQAAIVNVLAGRRPLPDGAFATPLRRAIVLHRVDPFIVS